MTEDRLLIGKIIKPHGIKGQVKVLSFAESPETFRDFGQVCLKEKKGRERLIKISSVILAGGGVALGLDGIEGREAAEALRDAELFITKDQLEELPEGEYYRHELIGLNIVTTEGLKIGKIEEVMPTGSNDVYVVRQGEKEYLVPALSEVIETIDLKKGEMIIKLFEGMIEGL